MIKTKIFSYGKWVATNFGATRNTRTQVLKKYLNRVYPIDHDLENGIKLKPINKNICAGSHRNK